MRAARYVWISVALVGCGEIVDPEPPDPVTGEVTISPATPKTADDLVASVTGQGTLRWTRNGGVRTDVTGDRIVNTLTTKDDLWAVDLLDEAGEVLAHDEVTIGNTAPSAPDARVEGTAVLTTTLRCLLIGTTSDEDSDPIAYSVTWQKNGMPFTTATMTTLAGDTIPAADRAAGDDFLCTLSASDGTDSVSATAGAEWFSPSGTSGMGTIQMFTVPSGVSSLFIEAGGSEGGFSDVAGGTYGARLAGTFAQPEGTALQILVGQPPAASLAGGGGTFVIGPGNMPLVIAGGGGSKNAGTIAPTESMGRIVTSGGTAGAAPRATNGSGGNVIAGSSSGAGGGFMTDGGGTGGGKSFVNGGAGAGTEYLGGFGGGGGRSGLWGQGGGGGYSGGSCGDTYDMATTTGTWVGCGGGGSINMGTAPSNTAGAVAGPGYVFIVW